MAAGHNRVRIDPARISLREERRSKLVPAVTAASIKLWKNYSCRRYRGIGQNSGEIAMKTILSALVALSVIAGVAGAASALDAKTFFEQIDRDHN
jgi:hypothetical protein